MKLPDFDKVFFQLSVLATIAVFVLIIPTTQVFASWYPDNEVVLWLIPLGIIFLSVLIWVTTSFFLPYLFAKGVLEERRSQDDRIPRYQGWERLQKRIAPILNFAMHVLLIAFFCYAIVRVMESDTLSHFLFSKV